MTWRVEFEPVDPQATLAALCVTHGDVRRECLIPQRLRVVECGDGTVWESHWYDFHPQAGTGWCAWVATGTHSYSRYLHRRLRGVG